MPAVKEKCIGTAYVEAVSTATVGGVIATAERKEEETTGGQTVDDIQ